MLFLGAGASKPLGIKTMQEFTEDLLELLNKRGLKHIGIEIIDSLNSFGIKPDFENIYNVIEELIDPEENIKKTGPFTVFVSRYGLATIKQTSRIFKDKLKLVTGDFKRHIYDECSKIDSSKCVELFDPILDLDRWAEIVSGPEKKNKWINVVKRIVTTNYDMALELYFAEKGLEFCDGFTDVKKTFYKQFDWGVISTSIWVNMDYKIAWSSLVYQT